MSIKLCSTVWESGAYQGTPLNVLLAMADHGKDDGSDIWPSIELVAFKARISERNAQLTVRKLEADGVLVCVGAATGGAGRTREYRLDVGRLMALGEAWRVKWEAALARKGRRKKGEAGFTVSRETAAEKGEAGFTLSDDERVKSSAKRVKSSVEKGEAAISPQPLEPSKGNLRAGARARGAPGAAVEPSGAPPSTAVLEPWLGESWAECRKVLGKALGEAWVRAWWDRCTPYKLAGTVLHGYAPSQFIADTVARKAAIPIANAGEVTLRVWVQPNGASDAA
ncbi:MAG: hypothetical protein AB7F67_03935 [Rhodospirillaceae bacterium]